jgi:nucleotide-binding universal stress UspA family protein
LFHVRAEAPEAVFDLGGDDGTTAYEGEISKWSDLKGTEIQTFMDKARNVFTTAGFPPDAVNTTIRSRKTGIARDIISESEIGCSAVVIGRKGFGTLPDFMMGSIAAKLAESITHVPLVIVGSQPEPARVLVAFDRSRSIRKGLEKVSRLFSRSLEEIQLCHIIRPLSVPHPATCTYFSTKTEAHWLDEHSRRIIPAMVQMKQQLSGTGFDPNIFRTTILKKKISRADAIVGEADAHAYGTIVVGRHGASTVETFSMGRVTRKILALAFNKAIWIV